jgi:hypothetical protein
MTTAGERTSNKKKRTLKQRPNNFNLMNERGNNNGNN